MTPSRRELLWQGAGAVIAAALPARSFAAADVLVEMRGTPRGERVWFAPAGLAVAPATTVRFVNRDAGNSHTATAYHPDLLGRQLRIPRGAAPWDSGFLMPGEAFAVTLSVPGIYDLYCQPHEAAGMVARIVVGRPGEGVTWSPAPDTGDLPAAAMAGFPTVEAILAGTLSRAGAERRPAVPRHARPGVAAGAAPPPTLGAPHPTTDPAAPRVFRRHAAPAEG